MPSSWKWYVYEIERDGVPIYVGKGCAKRAQASARQRDGKPIVIACFEHESAAYVFERERIKERLAQGLKLLNISHGTRLPWHRRKDTRQMAIEALQDMARRIGNWKRAGRIEELSKISRMDITFLNELHANWGVLVGVR